MSKDYIREQQSKGNSKVSRRWKVDVRDIVNNYNFHFVSANANGGCCDLCGSRLIFNAVIEGNSLVEGNTADKSTDKVLTVGFDCLQLVFGRDWNDYWKAKRSIDKLKKEAAQHRRVKDYAERYKEIIEWLTKTNKNFVDNNTFLSDMRTILLTGSKIFTVNMEGGIRKFMSSHNYSADEYERKLKHHKEVVLPRLKMVYDLVCRVDNIVPGTPSYEVPKWSSYGFVSDVYYKAKTLNKVSPSQLDWMNKVYERYVAKEEKRKNNGAEKVGEFVDTSSIPF